MPSQPINITIEHGEVAMVIMQYCHHLLEMFSQQDVDHLSFNVPGFDKPVSYTAGTKREDMIQEIERLRDSLYLQLHGRRN